ncbi:MAG: HNH endonuclease [Nitrospiraceae bacterium]
MKFLSPNLCKCGCLRPCGELAYVTRHDRWKITRRSPIDYVLEDHRYSSHCWIWQLKVGGDGYAQIKHNKRSFHAHIYYYRQYRGEYPTMINGWRAEVDHLCRVRTCVNPSHLEIVSQIENLRSGDVAGFNETDLASIREMYLSGKSQSQIGRHYGVSQSCIQKILSGSRWKGIAEPVEARRDSNLKLSPELVAQLRRSSKDGESNASLAKRFNIHISHVGNILAGRVWSATSTM